MSKAYGLLHGIKAGFLDDDEHFPLDVEHVTCTCLAKKFHIWGDLLKCPTSPRDTWPGDFISHGVPLSLKAS
jgi:hypothetical protein